MSVKAGTTSPPSNSFSLESCYEAFHSNWSKAEAEKPSLTPRSYRETGRAMFNGGSMVDIGNRVETKSRYLSMIKVQES